jgi:hypothetical protein
MKHKDLKYEINVAQELTEVAPTLASLKKANPFSVDEKYFDKLPVEILTRITEREKRSVYRNLLDVLLRPKYAIPIAASILLIIMAIFILNKPDSIISPSLVDYTFDDILTESPDIIESMDETLLIETLFADNGETMIGYFDDNFGNDSTLTPDELDDYLSEENLTPEIFNDY